MGGEASPTSTIISSKLGQSEKKTGDLKKEIETARRAGMRFTSCGPGYISNATSATLRNKGFLIKENAGGCKRVKMCAWRRRQTWRGRAAENTGC